MSIESMNGVKFGNEQQNKVPSKHPSVLLPTLAGAGLGYFAGEPISAKGVLAADKFELSKTQVKGLTEAQKTAVTNIQTAKDVGKKVSAEVERFIPKGNASIPIENYLEKAGYNDKTALETKLTEAKQAKQALTTKLKESENAINNLAVDAQEEIKKTKIMEFENVLKSFSEKEVEIAKHEAELKFVNAAKEVDGVKMITKEALTEKITQEMSSKSLGTIERNLELLKGKLPKVKSLKGAALYGAISLVVGLIANRVFNGKKDA